MKKVKKTELIGNIIACVLSFALTVFIWRYELYAMEQYSKALVADGNHPIGAAGIIIYIFFYIPFGAVFSALAVFTLCFTLTFVGAKKKEKPNFISEQSKAVKEKSRVLIWILILKGIAAVLSCYFIFVTFDSAYSTMISKTAYCVAFAVYILSFLLTFFNRRKFSKRQSTPLHLEK